MGQQRKSCLTNGARKAAVSTPPVVVTAESSPPNRELKKRGSFWRSKGVLLATVFWALLLDETLMTVIVPIVPDYVLNLCIQEKCSALIQLTDVIPAGCNLPSPSSADGIVAEFSHQNTTTVSPVKNTSTVGGGTSAWNVPSTSKLGEEASGTSSWTDGVNLVTMTQSTTISQTPEPFLTTTQKVMTPSSGGDEAPSIETTCEEEIIPKVGILFASKFILRIIVSPFVGALAHRIGFSRLLISGCVIMIASSLVYAFGVTYEVLLAARIIHGLGATLNEIGGLGLLAYRYRNDEKNRGFAIGVAIGGFAAGTLIGPPLGGVCYEFLGKASAFLIMAGLFVALGVWELGVFNSGFKHSQVFTKGSPLYKLIKDPYILGAAGALMVASGVIALLEPTLPIWMRTNIKPPPGAWQLGAAFLPTGVAYIISSTITGYVGYRLGRWLLSLGALVILAASVAAVPYTATFVELIGPMIGIGIGYGTVDSTMTAVLNTRVGTHHKGAYGGAAAISTLAFCLGFAIGPSISGFLTNAFGFKWLMRGIGVVTFLYAPVCIFLRHPAAGATTTTTTDHNGTNGVNEDDDVGDDVESIPIPPIAISRRLSRC